MRSLGKGASTSFWFDPWLKGGRIINRAGWDLLASWGRPRTMVGDFIKDGAWSLPPPPTASMAGIWREIKELEGLEECTA